MLRIPMLFTVLNIPQEETKESIRRKRKRRSDTDTTEAVAKADTATIPSKKRVAFAS